MHHKGDMSTKKSPDEASAGGEFHIATLTLIFIFSVVTFTFDLGIAGTPQWMMLARSFLAGKTFFLTKLPFLTDSVFLNGHYYWPFPPFPAILFMPIVAVFDFLKIPLYQGYVQLPIVIGVFFLVYRLAKKYVSADDAAWFAIAFTFASAFLWVGAAPTYSHLPYVVAVAALFGALLEYTGKKRWWLIGLLMAIALTARTAAGLGILFFLGDIFVVSKNAWRAKIKSAAILLAPFVATGILLALYNYVRFGSALESGYGIQILSIAAYAKARAYGVFSLTHIPGNLYYFLLAGPAPIFKDSISHVLTFPYLKADPWGMGLIFVSPYLAYLFFLDYKDKISWLLIAASIIIAIPIFTFWGVGFTQLGYRHALDFMPFVYFLFIRNYAAQYGALSTRLKWLIALSAILDLYFFFTLVFIPGMP